MFRAFDQSQKSTDGDKKFFFFFFFSMLLFLYKHDIMIPVEFRSLSW